MTIPIVDDPVNVRQHEDGDRCPAEGLRILARIIAGSIRGKGLDQVLEADGVIGQAVLLGGQKGIPMSQGADQEKNSQSGEEHG